MKIGNDNVTSQGQGTYNTVASSVGLLGALQNGTLGGILGGGNGRDGHGHHDDGHIPTERELRLGEELAASRAALGEVNAERYADQLVADAGLKIFEASQRADDRINGVIKDVADAVLQMSKEIGDLKGEVKYMSKDMERNREEYTRNFEEGKNYTNTKVDCLAQQTSSEIEKVYLNVKAANYVTGEVRVDPAILCGPSPLARDRDC